MRTWLTRHVVYPAYETLSGRRILTKLEELDTEQWESREALQALQLERLRELLHTAYETVPYYKRVFDRCGLSAKSVHSTDDLRTLPLLTKDIIREHKDKLINERYARDQLIVNHTGGSTGKALQFYQDQHQWDYGNAARLCANRWAGWEFGKRTLRLWGHPDDVALSQRLRGRIRSLVLNDQMFDTFHFSCAEMEALAERMNQRPPRMIIAYASSLYHFAHYLDQTGLTVPRPDGMISSAEVLDSSQRALIERVFEAPVFNRYGSREVDFIASECSEHAGLHIDIRRLVVEFVNEEGNPCNPGEPGRILVTDLTNYAMPFIRYDTGDVGVPNDQDCACGRGLPLMNNLAGRAVDILRRPDGRFVRPSAMTLVRNVNGIQQLQLIQETRALLRVHVVRDANYSMLSERELRSRLTRSFGPNMELEFEYLESIPLEPSGKYRFSISLVDDSGEKQPSDGRSALC